MSQLRYAVGFTPEMRELLKYNGIDVDRVTEAKVRHAAAEGVTEITVTMLALRPADLAQPVRPSPMQGETRP